MYSSGTLSPASTNGEFVSFSSSDSEDFISQKRFRDTSPKREEHKKSPFGKMEPSIQLESEPNAAPERRNNTFTQYNSHETSTSPTSVPSNRHKGSHFKAHHSRRGHSSGSNRRFFDHSANHERSFHSSASREEELFMPRQDYTTPPRSFLYKESLKALFTGVYGHPSQIRDSNFPSLVLPCLIITPCIFLLALLSTFPNWKTSILLLAAFAPLLLLPLCHLIDYRSIPLQHLALLTGCCSIGVAVFCEVAFHGALYSLFNFFQYPAFKQVVTHHGKSFHLVQVMSSNPLIRFFYVLFDASFVGFIEELCKLEAPLLVYWMFMRKQKRKATCAQKNFMLKSFWVLALVTVCSALGFAVIENVKYVLMTALQYEHVTLRRPVHSWWIEHMGYESYPFVMALLVALERAMISIPAHVLFSLCGILGVMEFMLWKQRENSLWASFHGRLTNREYYRQKKESLRQEVVTISKWLLVGMSLHASFDFLLMFSRESHFIDYQGHFMIFMAHLLIPIAIYLFVVQFVRMDRSWFQIVQLQVISTDSEKRDQSRHLLVESGDDEVADDLTERDLLVSKRS